MMIFMYSQNITFATVLYMKINIFYITIGYISSQYYIYIEAVYYYMYIADPFISIIFIPHLLYLLVYLKILFIITFIIYFHQLR